MMRFALTKYSLFTCLLQTRCGKAVLVASAYMLLNAIVYMYKEQETSEQQHRSVHHNMNTKKLNWICVSHFPPLPRYTGT